MKGQQKGEREEYCQQCKGEGERAKKGFKQEKERGGKLQKILRLQNCGLIGWLGKWESVGITLQL